MASAYILAIDLGTSSTKTTLWNMRGTITAEAEAPNFLHRPDPLQAEIDGDLWWKNVSGSIKKVVAKAGIAPGDIVGVGVDGMGWGLVPVDTDAKPLFPVLTWLDRRAGEEAEYMRHVHGADDLVCISANPIDEAYSTPKILWLKNHKPDVFCSTYRFLSATGYIVARLTGEMTCDYTQAYGYHFYEIRNKCWNPGMARRLEIPLEKMPRLCSPTEIVGEITPEAAAETGLRAGTSVIAGCLDASVGALGSGATRVGQTNEQGGQAGGFGISLDKVVVEPQLIFSDHVIEGQYLLAAGTVGGGSLEWFRSQFGSLETGISSFIGSSPFELLSLQASQSPPGSNGVIFLPYMAGERTPLWSSEPRGVFFGLSFNTRRADMIRAIMEGCAFAVQDNLMIAAERGVEVTEFFGSGGATKSDIWCQIKADVYGKRFVVAESNDGMEGGHSLGLFATTAFAVGRCDDLPGFVDSLLPERRYFEPAAENQTLYTELFQLYRNLSRKLLDDFSDLNRIRRNLL